MGAPVEWVLAAAAVAIVGLLVWGVRDRRAQRDDRVEVLRSLHGERVSALIGARFHLAKSRQVFDASFVVGDVVLNDGVPRVRILDVEVTKPHRRVYEGEAANLAESGLPLDDLWSLTAPDGQRHVWQRVGGPGTQSS